VVAPGEEVDDEEVERRLRVSHDIPMGRTGMGMAVVGMGVVMAGDF
jgi:hypothetical protein